MAYSNAWPYATYAWTDPVPNGLMPDGPQPWNPDPKRGDTVADDPLTQLLHHPDFEKLRHQIAASARLPDDMWAYIARLRSRPGWIPSKQLILGHTPSTAKLEDLWRSLAYTSQPEQSAQPGGLGLGLGLGHGPSTGVVAPAMTEGCVAPTSSKRRGGEGADGGSARNKVRKRPLEGTYKCAYGPRCRRRKWKRFGFYRNHLLTEHNIQVDQAEDLPQRLAFDGVRGDDADVVGGEEEAG
jgi:hypothetical protein